MKLTPNEKVWCPAEMPEYLCVLEPNQNPPKSGEILLLFQRLLLRRLAGEASPEEVEAANRQLESSLTPEELQNLPLNLLHNPKTASALLLQPAEINGRLAEWKGGMFGAINRPPMLPADAMKEAAELTLESFLSRLL